MLVRNPSVAQEANIQDRSVLIVVGAPGEDEFAPKFQQAARLWEEVCKSNVSELKIIDGTEAMPAGEIVQDDRTRILAWVRECKCKERWLIYIGHGTSDRDSTKWNLRGPDLSSEELAKSMAAQESIRWLVVHGGASSAPFINVLSGKNRVIITATKSGSEQNYARFGEFFAAALSQPESDLDHDESVSILEAFLMASKRVAQFYADEGRLASEQALIDDNGDGRGTPGVFYRGVRPVKAPADGLALDGGLSSRMIVVSLANASTMSASQRTAVEQTEEKIETLRTEKPTLDETEYYEKLERLLLEIVRIRELQPPESTGR